ncbi:RNA polymerase sigma factor [Urbifossiella limnaea]|uniref:ECF RNA polymerase sigma factor SigE n=1 Tax=Urbifossiella limnaea TaxID=2528023 RepID=A0A517XYI6_9BACT|nr:RNA polymerase sigma factor [Urbifossiella limnaea]QDU22551.1 ECF RNA polymerase sigma factor SigE [Urbifossiella limnaea]
MTAKLSALVHRIAGADPGDAADADLLARFVAGRDAAAFAELVRRHGPAVLGVCRRVTGDHHLAEDAFQAVFVVLAAKADCVRPAAALGGWLYGVAHRTALRARTMRDRHRRRERAAARPEAVPADPPDDLAAVLDAEIARLPDAQRAAVVLCELGGRSRAEAAAELGVKEGTLSSRLAAARKALAARLRSRGLSLPAALAPAVLAAVPPDLSARAAAAATTPHLLPAAVSALSQGVLRVMFLQKLKYVPLALAASAALAAGLLASPTPQPPPAAPPARVAADPPKAAPKGVTGPNRILLWQNGQVVSMDPTGANPKPALPTSLGTHPSMFVVSPDGKRVAAVMAPDGVKKAGAAGVGKLHLVDLGTADAKPEEVGDAAIAAWSADGTQLVVCSFTDGPSPKDVKSTTTVYTVATKTHIPVKLPDNHILTDWSRDGRHFLTAELGTEKDATLAGLWVTNRDGSPHKKLAGPDAAVFMGRFSPDARRVLGGVLKALPDETPKEQAERQKLGAARPRPQPVLTVFDVAAAKGMPVRDVPLNAELLGFCWSPDGRRIAYTWRETHPADTDPDTETQSHLTVCDPDGGNQRTILTDKGRSTREIVLGGVDWR